MRRYLTPLLLLSLLLPGCAQLPAEQELARLPVITFGEPVPADKPYILHFKAGNPISTEALIDGTLIGNPARQLLTVTLNKDIYSYKQWASFDGKHWDDARKLLRIKLDMKIPSHAYPQAGHLHLSVDAVPHS